MEKNFGNSCSKCKHTHRYHHYIISSDSTCQRLSRPALVGCCRLTNRASSSLLWRVAIHSKSWHTELSQPCSARRKLIPPWVYQQTRMQSLHHGHLKQIVLMGLEWKWMTKYTLMNVLFNVNWSGKDVLLTTKLEWYIGCYQLSTFARTGHSPMFSTKWEDLLHTRKFFHATYYA